MLIVLKCFLPSFPSNLVGPRPGAISNELGMGVVNTNDFMHGEMYIGHFSDIRSDLEGGWVRVL